MKQEEANLILHKMSKVIDNNQMVKTNCYHLYYLVNDLELHRKQFNEIHQKIQHKRSRAASNMSSRFRHSSYY